MSKTNQYAELEDKIAMTVTRGTPSISTAVGVLEHVKMMLWLITAKDSLKELLKE